MSSMNMFNMFVKVQQPQASNQRKPASALQAKAEELNRCESLGFPSVSASTRTKHTRVETKQMPQDSDIYMPLQLAAKATLNHTGGASAMTLVWVLRHHERNGDAVLLGSTVRATQALKCWIPRGSRRPLQPTVRNCRCLERHRNQRS